MKVGEYAQIPFRLSPQPCYAFVYAEYEDDGIVTELNNFVFKALAPGSVVITVNGGDLTAACTVIVTADPDDTGLDCKEGQ